MANEIFELFKSDEGSDSYDGSSQATLIYFIDGTASRSSARATFLAQLSTVHDGLVLNSVRLDRARPEAWIGKATYVEPDKADKQKLDTGDYRISFDTTGGTAHVTTANAQTAYGADPPDHIVDNKVVNVTEDNKVQGVDVPIPALKFSVTYRQPTATITQAYIVTLARMVGKVNDGTFYGFAAGEVLFLGAKGQQGTNTDPEITYDFLASENVTGLQIGDITGIAKKGHEYLWCMWRDAVDENEMVPFARNVFVAELHDEADFDNLGIGDGT